MDAQEQFTRDGGVSAAVFGKGEEFLLIPLDGEMAASIQLGKARGYVYCGVMSYMAGQSCAKCEENPDAVYTMMCAVVAFSELVAARLKPESDGGDWMERLYTLEDPRD